MFNNSYVQCSYFNVQFIIYFILFSLLFVVKKIMKSVLLYGSFKAISLGHWLSATKRQQWWITRTENPDYKRGWENKFYVLKSRICNLFHYLIVIFYRIKREIVMNFSIKLILLQRSIKLMNLAENLLN